MLNNNSVKFNDIEAVIVSKGPGSYTGLRIGVGTAKGICYALNLPLISVPTLKAMAYHMAKDKEYDFYCPMINSRRSEFFSSLYDVKNNEVISTKSEEMKISNYDLYNDKKVLFFSSAPERYFLKQSISLRGITAGFPELALTTFVV